MRFFSFYSYYQIEKEEFPKWKRLNEVYLIRRVKEEQDMDALHELVERYRPLINGAKLNFFHS